MAISCSLVLFLLISLFGFALAEIRFTKIRSNNCHIILFKEFGITHNGHLELNVFQIALSNPNPDLDLSKVGFFLCTVTHGCTCCKNSKRGMSLTLPVPNSSKSSPPSSPLMENPASTPFTKSPTPTNSRSSSLTSLVKLKYR
ncbi:hypothetical protein DITRI_Ditri07aG0113200 [Diplodiscus trichospermus]